MYIKSIPIYIKYLSNKFYKKYFCITFKKFLYFGCFIALRKKWEYVKAIAAI